MKLSDLCTVCEPSKYDPTIYDDYGDKVEPKLCDE